jgi:hypothetical protein
MELQSLLQSGDTNAMRSITASRGTQQSARRPDPAAHPPESSRQRPALQRRNRPLVSAARGATLLETCAALALVAAAATSVLGGLRPLACAFEVEAARSMLIDAMLEARRLAYESESNVAVATTVGASSVRVQPSGKQRALGERVRVTAAPSDGNVTFRSTGLADNATVSIACDSSTASVIVNQRGVIR